MGKLVSRCHFYHNPFYFFVTTIQNYTTYLICIFWILRYLVTFEHDPLMQSFLYLLTRSDIQNMTETPQLSASLHSQTEHDFDRKLLCDSSPSVLSKPGFLLLLIQDISVVPVKMKTLTFKCYGTSYIYISKNKYHT